MSSKSAATKRKVVKEDQTPPRKRVKQEITQEVDLKSSCIPSKTRKRLVKENACLEQETESPSERIKQEIELNEEDSKSSKPAKRKGVKEETGLKKETRPSRKKVKQEIEEEDLKPSWDLNTTLSERVQCPLWAVTNVVEMLENDNTIPFIARYRKERTDNLEVEKLREIKEEMDSLRDVEKKISSVIKSISSSNKLATDVKEALKNSQTLSEVEHLYAPFKPGSKKTLAARAKEAGLEPLALSVIKEPQKVDFYVAIQPKKDLKDVEDVKNGVQHIIADLISKHKEVMDFTRHEFKQGNITIEVQKSKSKDDEKEKNVAKYQNYIGTTYHIHRIQPHQVMAINRGENLKLLKLKVDVPHGIKDRIGFVANKFFMHPTTNDEQKTLVKNAYDDAYNRLIQPLMIRHIRKELTNKAEKASTEVFASNLKRLLLVPPVRGKIVMGLDPGFKNGCKYAVTAENGNIMKTGVFYLHNKNSNHIQYLISVIQETRCETIAIGNGTACRETEQVLSELIKKHAFGPLNVVYCIVNEAGASIYSASDEAIKEMPDLDVSLRGAVSIARRLQDPLAELVKIEPKHIGVGMYQHDISESKLKSSLNCVVEECVNFVGVDLNVCNDVILRRIAGLSQAKAEKVIEWRNSNGGFLNRQELMKVKGLGPKSYEQCAGFVRILPETRRKNSVPASSTVKVKVSKKAKTEDILFEPLDMTSIHPESYPAANLLIKKFKLDKMEIGQSLFIHGVISATHHLDVKATATELAIGEPTLILIITALKQLIGHDYRDEFQKPLFKAGMISVDDLKTGMSLTGRVTNRTHFGAFVDVGVGFDGLVHNSNMPMVDHRGRAALELGDKIEVNVISIERERKRLGLRLVRMV